MYIVEIVKDTFLQLYSAKMTIKAVVAFKIVSNFLWVQLKAFYPKGMHHSNGWYFIC